MLKKEINYFSNIIIHTLPALSSSNDSLFDIDPTKMRDMNNVVC